MCNFVEKRLIFFVYHIQYIPIENPFTRLEQQEIAEARGME